MPRGRSSRPARCGGSRPLRVERPATAWRAVHRARCRRPEIFARCSTSSMRRSACSTSSPSVNTPFPASSMASCSRPRPRSTAAPPTAAASSGSVGTSPQRNHRLGKGSGPSSRPATRSRSRWEGGRGRPPGLPAARGSRRGGDPARRRACGGPRRPSLDATTVMSQSSRTAPCSRPSAWPESVGPTAAVRLPSWLATQPAWCSRGRAATSSDFRFRVARIGTLRRSLRLDGVDDAHDDRADGRRVRRPKAAARRCPR